MERVGEGGDVVGEVGGGPPRTGRREPDAGAIRREQAEPERLRGLVRRGDVEAADEASVAVDHGVAAGIAVLPVPEPTTVGQGDATLFVPVGEREAPHATLSLDALTAHRGDPATARRRGPSALRSRA